MDVKNHNMNKEKPIMRKRLKVIAFLAFFLGIVLAVSQYFGFVSKTVYEESVSHLTEVFHQSDNMLRELSNKNLTYLHMWSKYLQDAPSESKIRDYIPNRYVRNGVDHHVPEVPDDLFAKIVLAVSKLFIKRTWDNLKSVQTVLMPSVFPQKNVLI
mgnify:CR=1 FL=1